MMLEEELAGSASVEIDDFRGGARRLRLSVDWSRDRSLFQPPLSSPLGSVFFLSWGP